MKHLETIISTRLFESVNKKDYILAFETLDVKTRRVRKDELIFCEDEDVDYICIPKGGRVRAEKIYPSGHTHIIEIVEDGDPFGFEIASSRKRSSFCDFVAEQDCEIIFISIESVYASKYASEFERSLCSMIADESIKKINKSFILSENILRERILAYFSILQKTSGTNTVEIKMNREQFSDYLCVNRSALSNELNNMKREGLIDFNKNTFTLHFNK